MTRFHVAAIIAAVAAAAALACLRFDLLAVTIAAFLVLMGLGVAMPRLRLFGDFVCVGNTSRRQIALTFDDGPDPASTPQLLALLRERKVPAAFFCIGRNLAAHPDLAAQIVREGHLLENHSFAHSNFTNFHPVSRLVDELERTQALIKQAGASPKYFRPPIGLSNPNTFRAAQKLNLRVVGWTIRSLDTVIANPQRIADRVTRQLRPGAIVLLHDGRLPTDQVTATVNLLLDTLERLGYEMVRLDVLLK